MIRVGEVEITWKILVSRIPPARNLLGSTFVKHPKAFETLECSHQLWMHIPKPGLFRTEGHFHHAAWPRPLNSRHDIRTQRRDVFPLGRWGSLVCLTRCCHDASPISLSLRQNPARSVSRLEQSETFSPVTIYYLDIRHF